MSFLSALCLLFIALKITNVIAWSWWLVMAPLYVPAFIAAIVFVIAISSDKKGVKF